MPRFARALCSLPGFLALVAIGLLAFASPHSAVEPSRGSASSGSERAIASEADASAAVFDLEANATGGGDGRRLGFSCPSGYYLVSGRLFQWSCGRGCPGGSVVNADCWCACQPLPTTTVTTTTTRLCPIGYYDITNGNYHTWACGWPRCHRHLTDSQCNCACQPIPTTVTTTTTTTTTTTQSLFCPRGYTQLGLIGDAVLGWGLSNVGNSASSIGDCRYQCGLQSARECAGFKYAPNYNGQGYKACGLFQIGQISTAAQTSYVPDMITCVLQGTCHNLALQLTPSHVTTLSGCNSQTDHDVLRTGNCVSTEWSLRLPRCMLRKTGVLIVDFQSDDSIPGTLGTPDKFEVFRDGSKVATWFNIANACNPARCIYRVPWYESSRTLRIKSTSGTTRLDWHASISAARFEQQALSSL